MAYDSDYPTEPIGGGNPYYRCARCKRSEPEINGDLQKHEPWCPYRLMKEGAEAEVRKQDEALIRQMLEALETAGVYPPSAQAAITAARARLGEKA